jgi:ABC-2 type transport system ATP-binding protein
MDSYIEIKSLGKSFGNRPVIADLNARISRGNCCVVAGPNGSGKSTLLKVICGLLKPDSGQVGFVLSGRKISPHFLFRHIGLTAPDLNLYAKLTVYENLLFFARLREVNNWDQRIAELIDFFQLEHFASQQLSCLSTGIKQRLKLASALVHDPGFLILDEPGAGLDQTGKMIISKVVDHQLKKGITVIATNDEEEVKKYGSEIINLDPSSRPGC